MNNDISKIYIIIFVLAIAFAQFFCCAGYAQTMTPINIEQIENNCFTLDFEKNDYSLSDVGAFFFTTFPHDDPTRGDVVYDRRQWVNEDMIALEKGEGLDLFIKSRNDDTRFDSVRMTSKSFYNLNEKTQRLLFVFKGKLPSSRGIWPAWWLNGSHQEKWTYQDSGKIETDTGLDIYSGKGHFYDTPSAVNPTDWPGAGEIDIIETINGDDVIHNTIHTCPQMCDSEWNNDGRIINCANAKQKDPNSGCSGKTYETTPEGTFACLWEMNRISFFYWTLDEDVRADGGPLSKNPDPDLWAKENQKNIVELLKSETECDSDVHQEWQCASCDSSNVCVFTNMKMIFNITLCGIWAGNNFDNTENSLTNCQNYISDEGRDQINNQFFRIEYISVSKM